MRRGGAAGQRGTIPDSGALHVIPRPVSDEVVRERTDGNVPRKGVTAMTASEQGRLHPAGEAPLVTSCGRRIEVKCLRLAAPERPISRIALEVGPDRGGEHGVWAALTASEARELAQRLLAQAELAAPTDSPRTKTPSSGALS